MIDRRNPENYIIDMAEFIVDNVGGTEFGPAASFRDIIRAIVNNTDEILSVDVPMNFPNMNERGYVSIPVRMGWNSVQPSTIFLMMMKKTNFRKPLRRSIKPIKR